MDDGSSQVAGPQLSESQLMTLALASQSPPVVTQLLQSGLPNYFAHTILGSFQPSLFMFESLT